ncbi:uncharacterized protein LOC143291276 [Babylonia areolata]|uniref:uncharacterized protein LOC143291276 n=1 Tax=Babylonia areolata TaxID=304850 RepID=UPI003FD152D8
MADDFVVTGTRPPSVAGLRPLTASSKDFGYYTKNRSSLVEETLFQSHHSSPLNAPVSFAAPWDKKPKGNSTMEAQKKTQKPSRPLLWAPDSTSTRFSINSKRSPPTKQSMDDSSDASSTFGTIQGVPLKHQYRPLKHTPTFVDETLFGEPLLEPSFKAPWEEKKKVRMYHWYQSQDGDRRPVRKRRPATALGLKGHSAPTSALPIWKP